MPNISILITCYNKAPLISEAIRSASRQEGVHEVVVVDDCSTDGSLEIIKRHDGITTLINPHNVGVSASTETAVRHAQESGADYVILLDGDDVLAPNALSYYAAVLEKTGADAIYSKVRRAATDCRSLATECDFSSNINIIDTPFDFYLKRIRATTAVCAKPHLMLLTYNSALRVQDHQIAFSIFQNSKRVVISEAITHYCSEGRGSNLSQDHLAVAGACVEMYVGTYLIAESHPAYKSYVDRSLRRALRIRHAGVMPWKFNLFLQILTPFKKLLPTVAKHQIMISIHNRL